MKNIIILFILLFSLCGSLESSKLDFLFAIPKDAPGVDLEGVKDVCIDESGNLYVTKTYSEYVFKLSKEGKLLNRLGEYGIEEGKFIIPEAVAIKGNHLYVTDVGSNRVNIFDITSNKLRLVIGGAFGERLNFPSEIVVDREGNLYVADKNNYRVVKFNKDGHAIRDFIIPNISAESMALDEEGNSLFIVDENKIKKFHKDSGTHMMTFDVDGEISAIAFNNKNQYLYIAYDGYKFKVCDRNGVTKNIVIDTASGFGPLSFGNIKKIRFDSTGYFLYITDNKNGCIQKLKWNDNNEKWEFKDVFASFNFKEGYFYEPTQMDIDKFGNFYVIDRKNKRVQKFNQDGMFINSFAEGYECEDIAIHHKQDQDLVLVYLAIPLLPGRQIGGIEVYSTDGIKQTSITGSTQTFTSPQAIAVNERLNKIYLIDGEFSRRLVIFNNDFNTIEKTISLSGLCTDIAIDGEDMLYIVDNAGKYINIYDKDGNFLTNFGGEGEIPGRFIFPYGIAISKERDLVYIADSDRLKNNVYIFAGYKAGNKYIGEVVQGQDIKNPEACAIYKNRLYIADTKNHRILVYGREGSGSSEKSITLWNYPNPFDPNKEKTTIKAEFTKTVNKVIIRIYNILGELVWEDQKIGYFLEGEREEITEWDGRDLWRKKVADGVYICLLEADGQKATNKILVIKDGRR